MADLVRSDDLRPAARRILSEVRERLAPLLPAHELVLTGGLSVPGALTKGDVDLHLRVDARDFAATVAVLRGLYPVVHPEIWQDTLATFAVPADLPAGLAVTPAGSAHDVRFRRGWDRIRADPGLLAEYNALKSAAYTALTSAEGTALTSAEGTALTSAEGTALTSGGGDYEAAKSAFFDRLDPAGSPRRGR